MSLEMKWVSLIQFPDKSPVKMHFMKISEDSPIFNCLIGMYEGMILIIKNYSLVEHSFEES